MKKTVAMMTLLSLSLTVAAQTLNVTVGSVTYQFPAAQAGEMTYADGTTLTVLGRSFNLCDITSMRVDDAEVTDNAVCVTYDGDQARVTVAGNIARWVTASVTGAHVCIEQGDETDEEITYTLQGASADGEFYVAGSYKSTVELNGLTLSNVNPVMSGAAVHVQNGKRIKVKVVTGTVNTLADAVTGSQKGCLYVKGHAEFAQKGALYYNNGVTENSNYTGDTERVSNACYSSPKGIKAGVRTQSGSGYAYGGGIDITGGTVTVSTSGRNAEGIESKNYLNIGGGDITVDAYDDGINSGQDMSITDGLVCVRSAANDALDSNGNLYMKGGTVYAAGGSSPELAIDANSEGQKKFYLTGGTLVALGGIESGSSLTQACYSASSWSRSTWYALSDGSGVALAFMTPASGGTTLIVSTSGTPALKSGVTVSGGTECFGGMGNVGGTVSGGTAVSLSQYSSGGGASGGGTPGGNRPGGRPW